MSMRLVASRDSKLGSEHLLHLPVVCQRRLILLGIDTTIVLAKSMYECRYTEEVSEDTWHIDLKTSNPWFLLVIL